MNSLDRITIISDVCGGKPTIRGKRLTVETPLGHLAAGESVCQILESFPFLEKDDSKAALEYERLNP